MTLSEHCITIRATRDQDTPAPSVRTVWLYRKTDPMAVTITFHPDDLTAVSWIVGRDLLTDGLDGLAGEGDIRVWTAGDAVVLSLSSPNGRATFRFPADPVRFFLRQTTDTVPRGAEAEHIEWDTERALMFAPRTRREG